MGIRETVKNCFLHISPTYRVVRRIENQVACLESQINAQAEKQEMMFWWGKMHPEESLTQAKKRFFLSLPKAEGPLRQLQLGSNEILKNLKTICQQEDILYWISFGTLLGAVRHKGFIPWDDDIDISFLRQDFERLSQVLKEHPQLKLVPYYHCKGHWHLYKVIFRKFPELFWVDITIWDKVDSSLLGKEKTWFQIQKVREKAYREIDRKTKYFVKEYCSDPVESKDEQIIQEIFQYFRQKLLLEGTPNAIYRSIDSVYLGGETLLSLTEIFPLITLEFEGECYPAPANYEKYLTSVYHYLNFPKEILPGHLDPNGQRLEKIELLSQKNISFK